MTLTELLACTRKGYMIQITDKFITVTDKRTNEVVVIVDVNHVTDVEQEIREGLCLKES